MNLDYKSKKWDKLVQEISKSEKFFKAHFTGDFCYYNMNNAYSKLISSDCRDYIWFYNYISYEFERAADVCSVLYRPNTEIFKNILFSVNSFAVFYSLILKNNIHNYNNKYTHYSYDLDKTDYFLLKAVSIDRIADFAEMFSETVVFNLYNKNCEKAKELIEQINTPTDIEREKEIYYTSNSFLKELYSSIIECNEKRFNELLVQRIKSYRKNSVDYTTIIDYSSIALIKIAQLYGIRSDCSVIEMPKAFFDKINFDITIPIPDALDRNLSYPSYGGNNYELQ